jgi:hypothetical protein
MCLIDKKKVRVAEENIPIFKIALVKEDGQYYSPYLYRNRLWKVNSCDFTIVEKSIMNPLYQQYGPGYFHAYLTEEYARYWLPQMQSLMSYNLLGHKSHLEVISGYIPEGTRYAKEDQEICAHKMILNI